MQTGAPVKINDLVALLKQQQTAGFSILYDQYAHILYGIIVKIVKDKAVAEDVLQESFVKVWKNIQHFNEEKGTFFTWLLNVTRYTAIDYLRSRQYKQFLKNQTVTGNEYIEEKLPSAGSEYSGLKEMVAKLEHKYREIIDLVYFMGYTQDEVSKILGLPLGTVKTRARAGLQILRKQM